MEFPLLLIQVALFGVLITIVFIIKKYFVSDWATLIRLWGWAMIGISSTIMLAVSVALLVLGDINPALLPMIIGSMAGLMFTFRRWMPELFRKMQSTIIITYLVISLGLVALLYNAGSY